MMARDYTRLRQEFGRSTRILHMHIIDLYIINGSAFWRVTVVRLNEE